MCRSNAEPVDVTEFAVVLGSMSRGYVYLYYVLNNGTFDCDNIAFLYANFSYAMTSQRKI